MPRASITETRAPAGISVAPSAGTSSSTSER
jgi:hypothetical protein